MHTLFPYIHAQFFHAHTHMGLYYQTLQTCYLREIDKLRSVFSIVSHHCTLACSNTQAYYGILTLQILNVLIVKAPGAWLKPTAQFFRCRNQPSDTDRGSGYSSRFGGGRRHRRHGLFRRTNTREVPDLALRLQPRPEVEIQATRNNVDVTNAA
jgi:hypothetical protein